LLEFTEDVPKAIAEIKKAIRNGLITQKEIDQRVRKILAVKQWVGLDKYQPLNTENILEELNTPEAKLLNRQLVEASMTVLKNDNNLLPIKKLDETEFASISFGAAKTTEFQKGLSLYMKFTHFQLPMDASEAQVSKVKAELEKFDVIVGGIHDDSKFPRNTNKFSQAVQDLISELAQKENSILVSFKNPYVLNKLKNVEEAAALIVAYQDTELTQQVAPQLI